ncbi:MAG: hypothetical protein U0270_27185 [Labilithrix sp.]
MSRFALARTLLLGAPVLAASCEGTNGDPPAPSPPVAVPDTPDSLTVELGTGDTAFEPLAEQGEVALVFGPQGGYHVWTAVRVRDASLLQGHVNLRAAYKGGSLAGLPSSEAPRWMDAPDGFVEAAGLRAFISDSLASGTELSLRAEVVARDGRHGAAERRVVIR